MLRSVLGGTDLMVNKCDSFLQRTYAILVLNIKGENPQNYVSLLAKV